MVLFHSETFGLNHYKSIGQGIDDVEIFFFFCSSSDDHFAQWSGPITGESLPQFEIRIMAQVYVRSIACSTSTKKLHFVSQNRRMENKFCSMWVQPY